MRAAKDLYKETSEVPNRLFILFPPELNANVCNPVKFIFNARLHSLYARVVSLVYVVLLEVERRVEAVADVEQVAHRADSFLFSPSRFIAAPPSGCAGGVAAVQRRHPGLSLQSYLRKLKTVLGCDQFCGARAHVYQGRAQRRGWSAPCLVVFKVIICACTFFDLCRQLR